VSTKNDGLRRAGWYHSGSASWEHPEIDFWVNPDDVIEPYVEHGPFSTFEEARQDFLEFLNVEMEYRKICAAQVRRLRNPEKKGGK
jgi:hypothetical protein